MNNLLSLLRQALGKPEARFHADQEEAIRAVLEPPFRALVVQATGWGKSMVYFLATRVLRDQGRGPTLVVSPLLSLMRNQVMSAQNLGLRAAYYTSANEDAWAEIESRVKRDEIDLLLVSPERLSNESFQNLVALSTLAKVGLIVIDEAHCISDWGHDFRPDYMRMGELIRRLPATTAVLATTATANERVVEDVLNQIGKDVKLIRGSLARKSLRIQVMTGLNAAERLAWLDSHLDDLPGSGIIYTLTVRDADRVSDWLRLREHSVDAYHAQIGSAEERGRLREEREQALMDNKVKALVSTVALGMGFDKPDLGFVVHYQSPGNLVAYYQQIGRAGRGIRDAIAVLFMGEEDAAVHDYFIQHARPPQANVEEVLDALESVDLGLSVAQLTENINLTESEVKRVLRLLSVMSPSPIVKVGPVYRRTPVLYEHDPAKEREIEARRHEELLRLQKFTKTQNCYMEMVRQELDDPMAAACGKCANCAGEDIVPMEYQSDSIQAALAFLNRSELPIKPRKQWPGRALPRYGFSGNIPVGLRCEVGLCLSQFGDPGVAQWTREDKNRGKFRDDLVTGMVQALQRVMPAARPDWVCAVPSSRSNQLVPDFAKKVAHALQIPYVESVVKVKQTQPQKAQHNGFHQAANLDGAFEIKEALAGTALLVDDMVDSGWTFTIIGALLRRAGADAVVPLALTSTRNRGEDE